MIDKFLCDFSSTIFKFWTIIFVLYGHRFQVYTIGHRSRLKNIQKNILFILLLFWLFHSFHSWKKNHIRNFLSKFQPFFTNLFFNGYGFVKSNLLDNFSTFNKFRLRILIIWSDFCHSFIIPQSQFIFPQCHMSSSTSEKISWNIYKNKLN